MSELQATLIGGTAILLWGALALFTVWTGLVPPFLLVGMTFTLAFGLMCAKWLIFRENPLKYLPKQKAVWILGVAGLFGYHALYFVALRNAPAMDASLIAYLWPLLIVVFSALLPGEERLRWFHIAGALCGLAGCWILISDGGQVSFKAEYTVGYLAAIACALTWSSYSVISRKFSHVATDTVGWFCMVTAILGFVFHGLFEETILPTDTIQWLAIVGLGLGPVGIAFFTWDIGVKKGNIKLLGASSYATPLISAVLLILAGRSEASWAIAIACLGIVGGAVLAAKEMIFGKGKSA
ncbi:DMT family transporter [Curvivirga sp.]|uniref:aromatic amino acid exporter YddG n=1 Tax=Curvivirga sp. TaxID=2856848 RepID=UPI003B5B2EC8